MISGDQRIDACDYRPDQTSAIGAQPHIGEKEVPYISPHVNLTSRTSQIGSRIINICFSHRNANLVQILFFWNEPQPALKTKKGRANFLYSSLKDGNFSVFAKIAAAAISQKLSLSAVVRTNGDNRNREEHNYVSETNPE